MIWLVKRVFQYYFHINFDYYGKYYRLNPFNQNHNQFHPKIVLANCEVILDYHYY
jgi:hypothetical protein